MKQTHRRSPSFFTIAITAGLLGSAGLAQSGTSVSSTGLAGFEPAAGADLAGQDLLTSESAHASSAARPVATLLTKVEARPDGNRMDVMVSGNGTIVYNAQLVGDRKLVVDVPRVQAAMQQSQLTLRHALLSRIRFGYHREKVRMVLDLTQPADHRIQATTEGLVITLLPKNGSAPVASSSSSDSVVIAAVADVEKGPLQSASRAIAAPLLVSRKAPKAIMHVQPVQMMMNAEPKEEEKKLENEVINGPSRYVGRRISLDFQQADISNVLRLIAEVSGFNIVVGEGVKNKVTMKLANVPWDQALDMLLKMNGLGMIRQGNIVWVDTLNNIAKQQDEEARAKDSKAKAEPVVTRVFYIRNLNAAEVQNSLRQYLSPRGVMNVSQASNALIVSDTESKLEVLRQLVEGVDLELPQVQIEARIVQADTTYTRSLGVQWGIQNVNQLGSSFGTAAFRTGTTGSFGAQTSDFLVNLPANPGFPSVPGAGFSIGKTDGALLDVRLSAGELLGLTKVIAAPKITTLDKRDAKIAQGESIPFQTTSLQGTQTTFVDANLELNVTPQITSRDPKEIGKQILMKVRATRNAVGARSNPAGPSIDRREATTQVLVRDGETMVIGGVFVDTQSNNVSGIPYLSRVPVLGWLFKSKTENVSKQELLIFLTPTIVKSAT
jgi:type IV pilus assembly protein PilQ